MAAIVTIDNPGALSLIDQSKLQNPGMVQEAIDSFITNSNVFTDIPLETIGQGALNGSHFIGADWTMPWVPLATDVTSQTLVPTPYAEQLWVIRQPIEIDRLQKDDKRNFGNLFNMQMDWMIKYVNFNVNNAFFNNTALINPNAMIGIRARLADPVKYQTNTECVINSGINCNDSNLSASTGIKFGILFQRMLDNMGCEDGEGVTFYGNEDLLRRIDATTRAMGAGGWNISQDNYDRNVKTFRKAKIRHAGRNAPTPNGVQTQVLGNENTDGSVNPAGNYTSLFAVRYGKKYFHGLQFKPMMLPAPWLMTNNGFMYKTLFEWMIGLEQPNTRAVSQAFNIQVI